MWFKHLSIRTVIISLILFSGLIWLTLSFRPHVAIRYFTRSKFSSSIYPTNASGQTYGSLADAPSPDQEPDLARVVTEDGIEGYVLNTDLIGEQPRNPEEAVEYMKKQKPGSFREINVYDVTGKYVIGKFKVGGGNGIEISPEKQK